MKITKHKMINNGKVVGVKLELEDVGYMSVDNSIDE